MDAACAVVLSAAGQSASSECARLTWFWKRLVLRCPRAWAQPLPALWSLGSNQELFPAPKRSEGRAGALGPATVASPTNSCLQSPRGLLAHPLPSTGAALSGLPGLPSLPWAWS